MVEGRKDPRRVEKDFDLAGLIKAETFGLAPLTAPLYSGELKAEGFFLLKFHTRIPNNQELVTYRPPRKRAMWIFCTGVYEPNPGDRPGRLFLGFTGMVALGRYTG